MSASAQQRRKNHEASKWLGWALFAMALGLVLLRNLPWHLDDKDQAKQAFIAVEMLHEGGKSWWFQSTPDDNIATKPPLMGWVNAALRAVGLPWDWAWRLPGIMASGWLLWALWQRGKQWGAGWIAFAGMACFGFNLLTPRLGALVRTDLLLSACCGWAIFVVYDILRKREQEQGQISAAKLEANSPQPELRASWVVVAALSLAALLKGPIAWVFLLPGAILFWLLSWWLERRGKLRSKSRFPLRWWAWVLPLLPFMAWSLAAMRWQEGFYEQVVLREFLGRFEAGEDATHNAQTPLFYLLQLSKALAPWVLLLLLVTVFDRGLWARVLKKPSLLWLVCAFLGALILMSAIPSKRLDRIFPALVPLALLIPAILTHLRQPKLAWRSAAFATSIAAVAYSGYAVIQVERNWPKSAAFTRVLREDLREKFAAQGISLAAGEVVSLERDYEALFVWLPEVVPISKNELKQRGLAGELRAVFVLQKKSSSVTKRFSSARRLEIIPSPAEAKNQEPLELWLLEAHSSAK